jgi:ribose transport system substrate-binding protein
VRNRFALAACAALVLGFASSGCQTNKKKTIAVIPKGTSHQFWVSVENGARKAGVDFNVDIIWSGPPQETEYGRQLEILDSMINRGVDGIAVAATEKKVLNQSLERAAAAGIPVTVFDSGVETDNYVSFVATNNYAAGALGAKELAKLIGGKGNVAVMMNMPGSVSTVDRERGFTETIAREFPEIKIVATQFGMADRAKAMAAAENILTAHGKLDGIFASSEPSSVGFSQALKGHGFAGKIRFVAFDSSESMIEDMKAGVIDAMVVQDPAKMGYEAVRTVVDKLNGKTPPKRIDLDARVLRKGDV